ncbi:MAG: hypothetical protein HZB98_09835 [Bacteroidia bacterium]|nr:hypothetical protein [Bacteroidia bacterium]
MKRITINCLSILAVIIIMIAACNNEESGRMTVNDKEYLTMPGLSVLAFHDFYPVGNLIRCVQSVKLIL